MPQIRTNRGETFESNKKSILEALQINGIYIHASCGGKGSCGRCKIKLLEGKVSSHSFYGISEKEKEQGFLLACQSYPVEDILIEVPEKLITVSERVSKAKKELIDRIFDEEPYLFHPLIEKINLKLNAPTIEDSRSDFERLIDIFGRRLNIRRRDAEKMVELLREKNWHITFALAENEIISFLPQNEKIYSLAVDIGTTTIVAALIDMEKGDILEIATCYNSQIAYGDDVITRIIYTLENPKGLEVLRKSIVDDIKALINTLSMRHGDGRIFYVLLSGNTIMCHIFWGLSPKYIREEPYTPVMNRYPLWRASEGMFNLKENVPIYTMPSVAGYVGGDIVSGVLTSGMYNEDAISLFIDIGTNGEVVVGNKEWLVTASTSAGPCFEGSGVSCGMRATEGAIEGFIFDGEIQKFKIKVIGNAHPIGICGSGMIDIIAELFNAGIIDQKGRLVKESSNYISLVDDDFRFNIAENCYISQTDIDNIIRSKAAIYAGISTLLQELGISEKEISKFYIAGGFGEFLNIKNAIKIGMLPNLSEEKFIFLGNASIAGAIMCLLSRELKEKAEEIATRMTYIDLSRSITFMNEYVSALFLPHTDIKRFQSN